jgi:hypothetical protein
LTVASHVSNLLLHKAVFVFVIAVFKHSM